jgi:hypothetical protein
VASKGILAFFSFLNYISSIAKSQAIKEVKAIGFPNKRLDG